jgi:thiamine biosynthesis protein ThiS
MLKNNYFNLRINGKQYKIFCFYHLTIYHLLIFFDFKVNLIAVEYNGKIISPNFYKTKFVISNSNIEIVTIVGGG